ncbi:MAG TPA: aspartate kinase [Polyangiaceae bacterium]|nr:aspartate kinase [Polyangiaceae bacterium]
MSRIVSKFGGTSLADAGQMRKVAQIVRSDARRKIVVPSAPGKRVSDEPKITDLLYLCYDTVSMQADSSGPFNTIRERYLGIEKELGLAPRMAEELERFRVQLSQGPTRDFVASRGEYLNGLIVAALLDAVFIDPADYVLIRSNGSVDPKTYERLGAAIADPNRMYVIPGFYGSDSHGRIKTFSRGGSDISGAIAARAANAELYENWTDVSGLLMADPRIVKNPSPMIEVTYREIRELSYMGAAVFHDEAILPVREAGIPICIKNTNDPSAPGTSIVTQLSPEVDKSTEIAGIAGKKGFSMVCLEKSLMNKEVGFAYRLLGVFERRGISVEHCPSSIDGMNVIVDAVQLGEQSDSVIDEIRRTLEPDRVEIEADLALIAVVGEGMAKSVGIAAKVFAALRDAGVNVRVINQGASELNIIVGVAPSDFETALRALYAAFITSGRLSEGPNRAA